MRALGFLLLMLAAPAFAAESPALVPEGEAVRCISQRQLVRTRVIDRQTIEFEVGQRIYHNRLAWACPNLDFEGSFRQFNGTAGLCQGDLITPINRGPPRATSNCPLGPFQPMVPRPQP